MRCASLFAVGCQLRPRCLRSLKTAQLSPSRLQRPCPSDSSITQKSNASLTRCLVMNYFDLTRSRYDEAREFTSKEREQKLFRSR